MAATDPIAGGGRARLADPQLDSRSSSLSDARGQSGSFTSGRSGDGCTSATEPQIPPLSNSGLRDPPLETSGVRESPLSALPAAQRLRPPRRHGGRGGSGLEDSDGGGRRAPAVVPAVSRHRPPLVLKDSTELATCFHSSSSSCLNFNQSGWQSQNSMPSDMPSLLQCLTRLLRHHRISRLLVWDHRIPEVRLHILLHIDTAHPASIVKRSKAVPDFSPPPRPSSCTWVIDSTAEATWIPGV